MFPTRIRWQLSFMLHKVFIISKNCLLLITFIKSLPDEKQNLKEEVGLKEKQKTAY